MKILAVDTSTMRGSVALIDGSNVIAEQLLNVQVTHSERLIPSVETVLETAGLELHDVDGFGVAIGPGSFTGLRIGLAAVKSMAFVLNKPVAGISTLTALAYNMSNTSRPVVSVIDARRGEVYVAVNMFQGEEIENILKDTVLPPEKAAESITISLGREPCEGKVVLLGDGVDKIKNFIGEAAIVPPPSFHHLRASNIAWLAAKKIISGGADDLAGLVPNYIRKSDAEK